LLILITARGWTQRYEASAAVRVQGATAAFRAASLSCQNAEQGANMHVNLGVDWGIPGQLA
jgi:hypothetical protein